MPPLFFIEKLLKRFYNGAIDTVVDTLKIYERLKTADLSDKAAKEIAEVIKEIVSEQLVTRQYLDLRLAEMKSDIVSGIVKWVAGMMVGQAAVIAALVKLL